MADLLVTSCDAPMVATGCYTSHPPPSPAFGRANCGPWIAKCSDPRCPHCGPGAPWRGEAYAGDVDVDGRGGRSSSSGGGAGAGACPARRLATNASCTLLQLLPVLVHLAYGAQDMGLWQWAADAAGGVLYALRALLTRLHAERDRQERSRQQQQVRKQPQQQQQAARRGEGGEGGRGAAGGSGEQQEQRPPPAAPLPYASGKGRTGVPYGSWQELAEAVDPVRLFRLQLTSPDEPPHIGTVQALQVLAITHGEELGRLVRQDVLAREMLVARVAQQQQQQQEKDGGIRDPGGLQPDIRAALEDVALMLEPSRALEGLLGRLGLPAVTRAARSRARGQVAFRAVAPVLVDWEDVAGLGVGVGEA